MNGISVDSQAFLCINKIGNELSSELVFSSHIEKVNNTTKELFKKESNIFSERNASLHIQDCHNIFNDTQSDHHSIGKYKGGASDEIIDQAKVNKNIKALDGIMNDIFLMLGEDDKHVDMASDKDIDTVDSAYKNINIEESVDNQEKENINKKLPDFITNNGLKKLNVNERLFFQGRKKRSFKNLLKPLFSPFKYINRNILPVNVKYINLNVNSMINDFEIQSKQDGNKSATIFSERLKTLNKTFTENTDEVINKKKSNRKLDNIIKYHTLERALECKLINDIKTLKKEFIADLAKNKFEKDFVNLPSDITKNLDDYFKDKSMEFNEAKSAIFSKDCIEKLKSELKSKINKLYENINTDSIIEKTFDSFMNERSIASGYNDFDTIKNDLSLVLTKKLFNQLSKNSDFIGENEAISKIDNLIRMTSDNIHKNISEVKGDIISKLKKGFYENIKHNKKRKDLLTRIFKNTSNNINYKWAQDAIILLISYESFEKKESKEEKVSHSNNNGVMEFGGEGSNTDKDSIMENELKIILHDLGLNFNDLDGAKDEVLRKYFANYFEHV